MTADADVLAPKRNTEIAAALVLAAMMMAGLFALSAMVVIWDFNRFSNKVGKLLQVEITTKSLDRNTTFAQDRARDLGRRIMQGKQHRVFADMPNQDQEHPLGSQPINKPYHIDQAATGIGQARSMPSPPNALAADAQDLLPSTIPVVGVRKLGLPGGPPPPDLRALYASGRIGAGMLGSPGQGTFRHKLMTMPSAPLAESLSPAPPAPDFYVPPESATTVSRRLVRERPSQGYPSLDDDIDAVFTVFQAPGEKYAYFRLRLSLKPTSRVESIPKDVLFLIDISQSISPLELKHVRRAVVAHLARLDRRDRWNVVLFSENTYYMHPDTPFVPAGEFDEEAVRKFIRRHVNERRTDVFQAARLILERVPQSERPCNVFLISDGKATQGTSDVRRIVHSFQRVKRDNFAIFTFNAGPGGNRYLLRLLSYRSRGILGNCKKLKQVTERLSEFCCSVAEPVLTNVVASYTNIRTSDVCPVVLPNLYRGHPITFWGRTTPGKQVAMRVAGMSADGPREFFFRTIVPQGNASTPGVVREWARGQAHEMIARLSDDPKNKELKREILALTRRYDLTDITEMLTGKRLIDLLPWRKK